MDLPNVELKPITAENWREAVKLKPRPDQEGFVAPNASSLLQGFYEPELNAKPYGIYAGDTMVGFIMSIKGDFLAEHVIVVMRLMIAADHQGKKFGRAAMERFIAQCKADPKLSRIVLSYVPNNIRAKAFYASLGFVEKGIRKEWGGEMEAWLDWE